MPAPRRALAAVALTTVLAGSACTIQRNGAGPADAARPSRTTSPTRSVAPAAPATWHLARNAPLKPANSFWSVAALDATHAWAVGSEDYSPARPDTSGVPAIQRWDGATWTREALPAADWHGGLNLVAADSATDVFAVGASSGPSPADTVTHVLHNDGAGWHEIPSPLGNGKSMALITGLAVTGGHAWLVGNAGSAVVIKEWNGHAWHSWQAPAECAQPGTSFGGMPTFCTFQSLVAFAPDDVWACGNGAWPGFEGPLLFHWDGSGWHPVQVGVNHKQMYLTAVAGRSSTDLWAVGNLFNTGTPLVVHGDGTHWTVVAGMPDGLLQGVAVDDAGRPWVIRNTTAPSAFLLDHTAGDSWDGGGAPTPPDTVGLSLHGITAVPGTSRMFAVGAAYLPTDPRTVEAVIEEYSPPDTLSFASPVPLS
jgi:hypothetical protein